MTPLPPKRASRGDVFSAFPILGFLASFRSQASIPDRMAGAKVSPAAFAEAKPRLLQRVGFWMLCAYGVSGLANDWALRLFGSKAYLSTIALLSIPILWLLSGTSLRGLRHPIGRWWLAFLVWLALATPLSVWKGGSAAMLWDFVPRSYMLFFYTAALVTSLRYCRFLMYANIFAALGTLLVCIIWGTYSNDARFYVPGQEAGLATMSNSNFVALSLLMGATSYIYLLYQRGAVKKSIAIAGIGISIVYMLKTGSRGCMLAAFAWAVVFLVLTPRWRAFLPLSLAAAAGLWALPSTTLSRLGQWGDGPDGGAEGSRQWRIEILKRSLRETAEHPFFGVGPDQFVVQIAAEGKEKGGWEPALGTHNSYTQVSSECGIPALIFYCSVILLCLSMNYRMFKITRNNPESTETAALSLSLLSGIVVYAVCNFFFHMAYTGTLPAIAGFTLALHNASRPILRKDAGFRL